MQRKLSILIALWLLVPFVGVRAELLDDRWYYMPPIGTYAQLQSARQASEGYGLYLGLGKIIAENWNLEFRSTYDRLKPDDTHRGGEWRQSGLGLDALYFVSRKDFSPYGVVGLAAVRDRVPGTDDIGLAAEAGLGMMYKLNPFGAVVRSDVRYRYDTDDQVPGGGAFDDLIFNFGFSIPFGDTPSKRSRKR